MVLGRLRKDRYLLVLLVSAVIFIAYWSAFAHYRYITFSSSYYDVGVEAYSLYWHVNGMSYYPNALSYIVFTNHMSLFSLLIIPLFALFQKPITFFLIQDIFLAMSSVLVYFTASDVIKSRKIGFAMAMAFLINPATLGLTFFDFHLEALAVFFYILSFYFYMKGRVHYFIMCYAILLSVYDVEPFVGLFLILGLLAYELLYNRKSSGNGRSSYKSRMYAIGVCLVITFAFVVFYGNAASYITNGYSTTSYSAIVPIQRLKGYVSEQFSVLLGTSSVSYNAVTLAGGAILGLLVFFLGFGVSSLANPVLSLILYAPWLIEVLVIHNTAFTYLYTQNYSFALGGSFVSAILGYMIIMKGLPNMLHLNGHSKGLENKVVAFIVVFAVILFLFDIFPVRSLLSLSYAPKMNYTQLNYALRLIPANSIVMAQSYIAPHLYYVHELELPPVDEPPWFKPVGVKVYWTQPDYIIINKNLQGYQELVNSTTFNIYNYTKKNYTIYYNNSGTYIFKKIK